MTVQYSVKAIANVYIESVLKIVAMLPICSAALSSITLDQDSLERVHSPNPSWITAEVTVRVNFE